MAALPTGDENSVGVASVEACVRHLMKLTEVDTAELVKRERQLQGYVETLTEYCDPSKNPTAYRVCQNSGQPAVKGLLVLGRAASRIEVRASVLVALARISFGSPESAAEVVTSELFEALLGVAFRPITEMKQQEEHLAALLLLQALAAAVPEAPMLARHLPCVAALILGEQTGYPACAPVRAAGVEVFVSCTLSHQLRNVAARLLPAPELTATMAEAEAPGRWGPAGAFPMGLLLANLCDLAEPSGEEPLRYFGDVGRGFWERTAFFGALARCLEASLSAEEYPPQSGIYHSPWKLAGTCMRLAMAGHGHELHPSIPLLASLVARVGEGEAGAEAGCTSTDGERAARLAAAALRGMAAEDEAVALMREAQELPAALRRMADAGEPAAQDLLEALEGGAGGDPQRGPAMYVTKTAAPF
mmetsp:Transcript_136233/g.303513  ORF Transcript_136233/g.303513 Transcript_136233/m.303513 type:complete len:418 (-) Transcript_136233:51-1304(-)